MNRATCQDFARAGDRLLREDSPERLAAERHFASCPSCAERAFLLDPGWAVRREGRPGRAGSSSFSAEEIAALQRNVLEAGRLRGVEDSVRRERSTVRLAAAAATLAILIAGGALLRTSGTLREPVVSASRSAGEPAVGAVAVAVAVAEENAPLTDAALEPALPAVAFVAPAAARVYDFGQKDFALVMVVHETLDL